MSSIGWMWRGFGGTLLSFLFTAPLLAADALPRVPEQIIAVEQELDSRDWNTVRALSWSARDNSVALAGYVTSREQLEALTEVGMEAANADRVDLSAVVVAGAGEANPQQALRDAIRSLQDGKRFENVTQAAKDLIASGDPQLQSTGVVLTALAHLHSGEPRQAAVWLRLARESEPALATPEGLRLFFASSNFEQLSRMSAEAWNTDIVNPYFVASRPLPRLLQSLADDEHDHGLARSAFRVGAARFSPVALQEVTTRDVVPADLPPDIDGDGHADEHPHHPHEGHAHPHPHWPATLDYGYGRACAYPYGWCPAYSNSFAPGHYYWHHRPTYAWTPYYFPGYVPTFTAWWPYYGTAYSYPYPYAAGYPYWYGYAAPYPYAYYPYAYGVTFPYAYSYPYAPGYGYAAYPAYYGSAWSWPTYDGWYSYRYGYSTLGLSGWYPGRHLFAWLHR